MLRNNLLAPNTESLFHGPGIILQSLVGSIPFLLVLNFNLGHNLQLKTHHTWCLLSERRESATCVVRILSSKVYFREVGGLVIRWRSGSVILSIIIHSEVGSLGFV